jgi:large subunit ribosomal protein L10
MAKAEKAEKVADLKARIASSQALLLTEYRGLTVSDTKELRRSLGEEARFAVVKNTLMKRAAEEAGIEQLGALLEGPTAVAFIGGDPVAAAKKVVDAGKKHPALMLKGAYMEGRVLSAAEAQSLATLESREVMLSRIAGLLKSEMSRAASMLVTLQSRFVGLLEAYRDKLPGQPEADTPAETAPEAETPAPEAETPEAPAPEAETPAPEAEAPAEAAPEAEAADAEVAETEEAPGPEASGGQEDGEE